MDRENRSSIWYNSILIDMEGWIKLHRDTQNNWIFKNSKYLRAWIYFLFRANYSDNKVFIGNHIEYIKRGQFITSLNNISKDTQMTLQVTRTFLSLLIKDEMILKESSTKLTKITICNYDKYQDNQQASNTPATHHQQTSNKPATTVEEGKEEIKKDKKEKNIIPPPLFLVSKYCTERKNDINAQHFIDWYEVRGWKVGNNKMKDWQAAIRTWENRDRKPQEKLMMP